MAEARLYAPPSQLDIKQIILEAQHRWLRPAEICAILGNYKKFRIAPEPAHMPPSGSLFLFDRKVLRHFRKDGHNWRKKKDGKTVREAHERLKAGSVDVLHCYYAHGEENENFQRRTYWLLEEELSHIVLVHYRQVKGTKANFTSAKENEESLPYAQQTDKIMPQTEMDTSLSSTLHPHSYQVPSKTVDTSMNSAQTSEYEEAESDDQEKLPIIPGVNYISLTQDNKNKDILNAGLTYESPKPLGFYSWEGILENNAGSQHVHFQPLFPGTQPDNMGINSNFSQGEEIMVPYLTTSIAKQHENGSIIKAEGNWQVYDVDSLRMSSWPIDSAYSGSTCEVSCSNREQEVNDVDFQKSLEQCLLHSHKQNKVLMQNDLQEKLLNEKEKIKSNLEAYGIEDTYLSFKRTLLDGPPAEEGLKKLDSFNQWMSKELGDVEESNKPSTSGGYWDTVETENEVGNTTIPSQGHLDTYVLDPSVSHDQLFSIIDYSPSWAFEGSEIKVIISGEFLRSQHEAEQCKWSCMFGEVEVPAVIIAKGVLCCHTPPHKAGRVPFYVTCSNRLACSEVREFDFQVHYTPEDTTGENRGSTFDTFSIRFGELLSLGHAFPQNSDSISVSEKSQLRSKINSLLREDDDDWDKLLKLTQEKDFSPENLREQLLQNLLKDKLHAWLLQKITEEGKGPNVLDEGGQGVLHFAAALGYDWALEPTIVAGVNVNFRDVNGWTSLHWAAFCGRERTVAFLISLGAAPGALTDPCPEHPSGRTPADLASANGHKGIAGYLAESSLSAHLTTLDLNRDAGENSGAKVVQRLQNIAQVNDLDGLSYELSLKDSLAAVCNATQAAARIHQVFRMQSFQRKQLKEYDDDKLGLSDERALSLIKMNVKSHKSGPRDEPVHAAAIRIQNKFRSWKGRREFLMIRQRIVKIQAHVRGHQVRKSCGKIIWSVGILEKVILRWRRKGSGLRGFKPEANSEGTMIQDVSSTDDDYDVLKEGRKQTEQRLQKALARVKSMVQYPEARDQYHRLLNVVTEIQENQVKHESSSNNSEEPREFGDLNDLEALLDEDIFMPTAT
ncbi:calmodulin-binding transcription activator 1-like isoform X2 [Glycine soja]|uniref:Calmodulin-binding transcription activator 2 isoform C n=2 Tax=Glycine soja TaxID=3848 RepID=A0A445JE82_GLYSO|nr:calmodulin-binding transcription activator 1-like isoform X2 [Glycine soja]RZB96762.1 Calmodulin-binding transcription activator 2 isoform C [Glycine soja]